MSEDGRKVEECESGKWKMVTKKEKVMERKKEQEMEKAARSRSERWPARDWVKTVMENMARRVKMEGAAICQRLFDSEHGSLNLCFVGDDDGGSATATVHHVFD
ncbi:hypothetical protein PIB30_061226 [Stylosanthes scabra]|uniref:Uncharacterized protein n=1 Tax=Stylosanthes scabra TaxID=79078 RepID=A0ABU6SL94_9FABA|nr:hypothetical protein [Stylosanthes scabra]